MAWIISKKLADRLGNSLFAPEQEVDCSAQKSSVSKPSAQSKLSPIVRGYYVSGKTKAHSRYSRFGIISKRLTEDLGGAMPTLSQPASPVRTSQVLIISESDSMERKAPYFTKYTESFAKLSPDGCSWKTPHCLPGLDSTLSSNTWPRQGMMRNGECWQRPPLEHPISERGSGDYFGGKLPTPTAKDSFYRDLPSSRKRREVGLGVRFGGKTNPDWVEWIMGWPIGWTALKPLETDKSLHVWQKLFCNSRGGF